MEMPVIHTAAIYFNLGPFLDKLGNAKYHGKSQFRIDILLYYS